MTEKLPLTSQTPLEQRLEALKSLIPEAFSEGNIDFNKLRSALGNIVDTNAERYGLSWAGKSEAVRAVQIPSKGTLEPLFDKSVNFDSSQNLIIEGDNLEVLKLLQKSYYGKIKMIYIDPPYNTGNEFIYPDNFREGLEDYLVYSGQRENDGTRLSSSEERNGRKHSKWLNMMYPRLFLARNLLREDGVIFVSIDDNEVKNLRGLMDEIFGEDNFLGMMVWRNSSRASDKIAIEHEYIVVYARQSVDLLDDVWSQSREEAQELMQLVEQARTKNKSLEATTEQLRKKIKNYQERDEARGTKQFSWLTNYSNIDENWKIYYAVDLSGEGSGPPRKFGEKVIDPPPGRHWMSQEYIDDLDDEGRIVWRSDRAYRKLYIEETVEGLKSVIDIPTRRGSEFLKSLLGKDIFDKPKPTDLIKQIARFILKENDILLDFFAGSGTSANAIINLNEQDGGSRKFIMVQLPEKTGREDYKTITDICLERTRRVIKKLDDADNGSLGLNGKPDRGFKAFALRASNFKVWDGEVNTQEKLEEQLSLIAENLEPGEADEQGILFEIMLKAGLPLTAAIAELSLGQKVYAVEDKTLYICLAQPITEATLKEIVAARPQTFVCLDVAFEGNDQLKTNTLLQTRNAGIRFYTV